MSSRSRGPPGAFGWPPPPPPRAPEGGAGVPWAWIGGGAVVAAVAAAAGVYLSGGGGGGRPAAASGGRAGGQGEGREPRESAERARRCAASEAAARLEETLEEDRAAELEAEALAAAGGDVDVVGIRNIGNTCFMNSVLQALASLPRFRAYVAALGRRMPDDAFLAAFSGYLSPPGGGGGGGGARSLVHDPTRFHALMAREARRFGDYGQHDASEFFNYVLDVLERKAGLAAEAARAGYAAAGGADPALLLTGAAPPAETAARAGAAARAAAALEAAAGVSDPFVGTTGSFLRCGDCGFESPVRHDRFDHVTLQLPYQIGRQVTVYSLLDLFTLREEVEGVRCAICTARATVARIDSRLGRAKHAASHGALLRQRRRLAVELGSYGVRVSRPPPCSASLPPAAGGGGGGGGGDSEDGQDAGAPAPDRGAVPPGYFGSRVRYLDEAPAPGDAAPAAASGEAALRALEAERAAASRGWVKPEVRKATAAKQLKFARLPPVLCLHVSRLMGGTKNGAYVAFPLVLNLAPYVGGDEYARLARPGGTGGGGGGAPVPPYLLCAAVVHHGGAFSGHYTIYRRVSHFGAAAAGPGGACPDLRDSRWVHVSDHSVVKCGLNSVLTCEAYMLFYERWDGAAGGGGGGGGVRF